MDVYLENNATKKNYTQHPKVIILDEFYRRRNYFKNIREKYLYNLTIVDPTG